MEFSREPIVWLFGVAAIVFSLYCFIKGEVVTGPEDGDPRGDRTTTGTRARVVAIILLAGSIALFFNVTAGICVFFGAIVLAWFLGR